MMTIEAKTGQSASKNDCQSVLDHFLSVETERDRLATLDKLVALPDADQEAVAGCLVSRLNEEKNLLDARLKRGWYLTALGRLHRTKLDASFKVLKEALIWPEQKQGDETKREPNETFQWTRYWAAVSLARLWRRERDAETSSSSQIDFHERYVCFFLGLLENPEECALVKAVILRILVEHDVNDLCINTATLRTLAIGPDEVGAETSGRERVTPLEVLLTMLQSPYWENRWNACKALRRQAATCSQAPYFSAEVENELLLRLTSLLNDPKILHTVQYQAARALRSLHHENRRLVSSLQDVLYGARLTHSVRRVIVDTLETFPIPDLDTVTSQPVLSSDRLQKQARNRTIRGLKNTLLLLLEDDDAEIRKRAACGLIHAMQYVEIDDQFEDNVRPDQQRLHDDDRRNQEAVAFIIDHLVEEAPFGEQNQISDRCDRYIEALRAIDHNTAAARLKEYLTHPHTQTRERAKWILTHLGGETALETLYTQREKTLNQYANMLDEADKKVTRQFELLMGRARFAFLVNMIMHIGIFVVGIMTLAFSLRLALTNESNGLESITEIGGISSGLVMTLLSLFYRSPVREVQRSVTNLVKVNVVFLGFIRCVNQLDATFKHLFIDPGQFNPDKTDQTVKGIKDTVAAALKEINLYLGDSASDDLIGQMDDMIKQQGQQATTSRNGHVQPQAEHTKGQ